MKAARPISHRSWWFILISVALLIATPCFALWPREFRNENGRTELLWHQSGVLVFRAGMAIDADGSPHAYSPVPGEGLDALDNAGGPGHWNGIVTRDGEPVLQGPDDPAPGYYISQTALEDESQPSGSQRRFIDAEKIPYISMPSSISGARLGDVAIVVNSRNGRWSPAIVADEGPTTGEGSVALAKALGVNANPRFGGTTSGIVYVVFEHSGNGRAMRTDAVLKVIQEKLANPGFKDMLSDAVGSIVDLSAFSEPTVDDVQGSDGAQAAE